MIELLKDIQSQRRFSPREAIQTFCQIIVLKNLSWKEEQFIGGTALVFGFGNPRFSEDIDLTHVQNPLALEPYLKKALKELSDWLKEELEEAPKLLSPKKGKATWKISAKIRREGIVRLHIDSQKYPTHSHHPIVVSFRGIPPFIVASVSVEELMADKLIAVALRNYVSGRDLFDLWYHWLKNSKEEMNEKVFSFLEMKKKDRSIEENIFSRIESRLSLKIPARVLDEWNRYLPAPLKNGILYENIYSSVHSALLKIGRPL